MKFKTLAIFLSLSSSSFAQKTNVGDLYTTHCASCHGANSEGGVGGSLFDGKWKYGSTDAEIYQSIAKGNIPLGMTPWEGILSNEEIRSLVIFIREKENETLTKGISFPKPSETEVTKTELHDYRIETLVDKGLEEPWAIAFLPDGRKLVTEKTGKLRVITAEGKLDPKEIKGIPESVDLGQGGLMEVALHPDYDKNGWIYLGLSDGTSVKNDQGNEAGKATTAVVRGKIKGYEWTEQEWIYRPDSKFHSTSGVHFGTRFVFDKGYIYFPIGERGGMMQAQELNNPNGKIFRFHDDGRVPADNPFVNTPDAIPGIWSYGHRNPQGLALDPRDGTIYNTEHGPRGGDELNLIAAGKNYGWPVITFGMNYNGTPMVAITEKEGMEQPLTVWVPSIAVCGLDFYVGEKFPKWQNDLLVGALAKQEIRRVRIENQKVVSQEVIFKNFGRVRDVATGPDGFIYVLTNGPDRLVRMIPAGN